MKKRKGVKEEVSRRKREVVEKEVSRKRRGFEKEVM
jgi:hypothetical protein